MSTILELPHVEPISGLVPQTTPVQLQSGLGGAIGSDFRTAQNQLVFVEYNPGKLSALNLFSPSTVVSSGTTTLKGTFLFDLDTGVQGGPAATADIWWDQQTTVARQMVPQNSAVILNLGVANFNAITANNLEFLPYATTPINGNNDSTNKLIAGDVFAVRTTQGNFAKVKVITYGYDLQIQWVTYKLMSAYVVFGTGYSNPEDVKVSKDGVHAYVTERSGNFVRVSLANANRSSATLVVSGLTAPQQIALDEAHNAAYVIEYAATGRLWKINLTTGAKTAILSNLNFAVGIVLSPDLQYAYISEQTTGPDHGRVSRFRLSDGTRQAVATGLTAPFDLTWADSACTSVFVTERDPANRVTRIDVTSGSSNLVSVVAFRPSSVSLVGTSRLLVCCDQVIQSIDLVPLQSSAPLLMEIGFIPCTDITPGGLADTSADPGAHYPVKNVPFGGTLPLMINHQRAANDGAAYYRVKIDGIVRMDTWTDDRWNGVTFVTETMTPIVVNSQPGYYPVRPVSDLLLWLHPALGSLTDSTNLTNGLHTIQAEFVDSTGHLIEMSNSVLIHVDNGHCTAALATPALNNNTADPNCGLLHYTGATSMPVTMPLTATHPNGFATYSFEVVKGVNQIIGLGGPVPAASPVTSPASTLLGNCTIAAFGEYLYVAAMANNGWSRQSQYDASAAIAFVLAP
jgi:Strictosidine synthase